MQHQLPLTDQKGSLGLHLPNTDDRGQLEKWSVSKIWWGKKASMGDTSQVASTHTLDQTHPRKLFIRKLPKIKTDKDVEERKHGLFLAFWKYARPRGVTVIAPKKKPYAFVEFEREEQATAALEAMRGQFSMTRAKYTRKEALEHRRQGQAAQSVGGASPMEF